jgi:hypothetical protein
LNGFNAFSLLNMAMKAGGLEDLTKMSQTAQKNIRRMRSSNAKVKEVEYTDNKFIEPDRQGSKDADGSIVDRSQADKHQVGAQHAHQKTSVTTEHRENKNTAGLLEIDNESVLKGIIYSEIFSRPKALRKQHRL